MKTLWLRGCLGLLSLALIGLLPACAGQLITEDDDDAGDDDGADDDGADDDAGDDDAGDDDAGDDDAGDDDAGDDDAEIPPQPGFIWDIPGGPLAGHYEFDHDVFCDWYEGSPGVWASADWQWDEMIGYTLWSEPGGNEHVTDCYFAMAIGPYWFEQYCDNSCWIKTVQGWPHVTGFFQCEGVEGWTEQGNGTTIDVINGAFRCP